MNVFLVRADGVTVELDNLDGKKIDRDHGPRRTFLSWDDVKKLELERQGYAVVKETAKQLRKKK